MVLIFNNSNVGFLEKSIISIELKLNGSIKINDLLDF